MSRRTPKTFTLVLVLGLFSVTASHASDAELLSAVFRDDEYQDFVKSLEPWIQPLNAQERDMAVKDLMAATWGEFEDLFMTVFLPAVMKSGGDLSKISLEDFENDGTRASMGNAFRISSNLLSDETKLRQLSVEQFSDATLLLGFSMMMNYFSIRLEWEPEIKQDYYDTLFMALELTDLYFPNHSETQDNKSIVGLIKPLLRAMAPLPASTQTEFGPITNADIEWLRTRLAPWIRSLGIDEANYSVLEHGLPGHAQTTKVEEFFSSVKDGFPFLILFYRPDSYRDTPFQCSEHEISLLGKSSKAAASCNQRWVELGLNMYMFQKASKTGEKIDRTWTYEAMNIMIFQATHYGDLLATYKPQIFDILRHWAQGYTMALELIQRPDEELNELELLLKAQFGTMMNNPERAKQLGRDLAVFLEN